MGKVFLGGTCNGSAWRDELIPMLEIDYFNPVVEDWTEDCQAIEESEKRHLCNVHLYVITSDMTGVFSIAEAIESSMTHGKSTIFFVMPDGFSRGQIKSLDAVSAMVCKHKGMALSGSNLIGLAQLMNSYE